MKRIKGFEEGRTLGLAGREPTSPSSKWASEAVARRAANPSVLKTGPHSSSPGQAGLRSWLTPASELLSSECSPPPHPVAHLDPGLAVQNRAQGRASGETFASVSWVFIPASQCHRHHHHHQKVVLGAGVPSCSPRLHPPPQTALWASELSELPL